jgi:capsular exopolysaccharide synthesis family protein
MNQNIQTPVNKRPDSIFGTINPQKIVKIILNNWYWYLITIVLAAAGSYFYMKYKLPSYVMTTTILVEEEDDNTMMDENLLQGFALGQGIQNLDNQMYIISSYSIVRKAIEDLPFEVNVYKKGFASQISYYPQSPIRVEPGPEGLPYGTDFRFKYLGDETFRLTTSSFYKMDSTFTFGKPITYANKTFTIYPEPEMAHVYQSGDNIHFEFQDQDRLTLVYMNRMEVELAARDGSIVEISLEGTNRVKDMVFLDKLTEVYLNDNLDKKNAEAERIIAFIEKQVDDVQDSLQITENELQEYRSRNQIMDISAQAQHILDQAVVLENERAQLNLKREYYQYLDDYMAQEENETAPIAPSSMGIEDPLLATHMQELAGLQAEYFSAGVGERNPLQGQLELRIRNSKNSIRETLTGIIRANELSLQENQNQLSRLNAEAANLPVTERQLLGFERRFSLNNELYTFLMQERANAQIQAASNTPDNVLVDPARASIQISPLWMYTIVFAFALAIGIPTLILLIGNILQNKVATEEDLDLMTDLPVIGHFPHSRLSYNTVVLTEPSSVVAESFRNLRTRLEFFIGEIACPILVISSSMPGEGKSFAAINLASAYSLAGKKTLLVGLDLRKPSVQKSFELQDDVGISSYLIGKKKLDQVIHDTEFENLYVLPSGPIPPNPGELTSSDKTLEMFSTLKKKFDYIIVDSAPLGVVSDIYPVARMADAVLIMVRHNHTKKNILSAAVNEMQLHELKSIGLLMNDIKSKSESYRYSYKYKYGYSEAVT